ncbi:MAG: AAA family ATPase [Ottowia sp.]|nr:AAA family ATPase [Ottowia sp.]
MRLEFGSRLNLLTGDNSLGKTFILDIVWWAMTRKWPAEVNPRLIAGKKAVPPIGQEGKIAFLFAEKPEGEEYTSTFNRREQSWPVRADRPPFPGLVMYAMSDGSFALWDPHRNYWAHPSGMDAQKRLPAYVLSQAEVWDGKRGFDGRSWACNGLLRDWASWQKENGVQFKHLEQVLAKLSPAPGEALCPGSLTRVDLGDARDMPTVHMPYGQDVAVVHASSGVRRILAIAYMLVWAWHEHLMAAHLLGEQTAQHITFLIDEIEAHLHPRWQRCIVKALISAAQSLGNDAASTNVQLLASTHSPLVMASVEPLFDPEKDAWFDLDLLRDSQVAKVALNKRDFIKQGDASNWLASEAFDLPSGYSLPAEEALNEAAKAMSAESFDAAQAKALEERLRGVLSDIDPFWIRWRFVAQKKGWAT